MEDAGADGLAQSFGTDAQARAREGLSSAPGSPSPPSFATSGFAPRFPGLWQAAIQVATPHLRNMGTIGGNLCLDTRCNYYDQSYEWRKAIDFCMKKDGEICWVATSSPRCLAVSSTDTAPMLQALDARVRLVSASGERELSIADLYANDGMHYLTKRAGRDPHRGDRSRRRTAGAAPTGSSGAADRSTSRWRRWRRRPVWTPTGACRRARLVAGAVASRPLSAPRAESLLVGETLTDERIAAAAARRLRIAKPMDNTDFELVWRKKMVTTLATYALRELRGDDMRARAAQRLAPGAKIGGDLRESRAADLGIPGRICRPRIVYNARRALMRAVFLLATAFLMLARGPAVQTQPAMGDLLDRASRYVVDYEGSFSILALDEESVQWLERPINPGTQPLALQPRRRHGRAASRQPAGDQVRLRPRPGRSRAGLAAVS